MKEDKEKEILVGKPETISKIEPIEQSRDQMIRERKQIKELVEIPLLSACEEFYDKNIKTLSTSANKKDIETGEASITIDFDSLSEENKKIGESLGEIYGDERNCLKIKIPINEKSSFVEVEESADLIASKFLKQKMTWAPRYTLKDIREIFAKDRDDESFDLEAVKKAVGELFYYDENEGLFYESEEHYKKANEEALNSSD